MAAGVVAAGCAGAGGETETSTTSSGSPVVSSSLSVSDVSCGESEGASVAWGEREVSVDGSLPVASPCYTAALETVSYDAGADELLVRAGAARRDDVDECVQCLADVAYTATVVFDGALPESVRVEHRSREGTRTVAAASRGGERSSRVGRRE